MNAAPATTPDLITATTMAQPSPFARALTCYADSRSMDELLAEAYPTYRRPGGYGRWLDAQRNALFLARRTRRSCAVGGCGRQRRAKGLCAMHYMRARRTGYPLGTEDPRWQAAHPRPEPPTPAQIVAEMRQALDRLREVVGR